MSLPPLLLDTIRYTLPGLAMVIVAFYLIKPYLDRYEKVKLLMLKKSQGSHTITLQLQAYERVVLFIERINPANMLLRLNAPSFAATELHAMILTEIRNEFQHNVTQQIYISERAWAVVKKVKNDTLTVINNAAYELPENAGGLELAKAIMSRFSQVEENLYESAAALLRRDAEQLF
ncbi:hypothetical protein DJ568_11220 [Mucilaginibacter hurinus]|uniref:Uncharacterized protein n=1 Tax=Mucilaginibacter hurinus TaxID=2201324 RepID=A0A367GNH0_9SPHI|nr:hypothetical protein [Mucilaginibacter hurinus]RCH55034.1 hypothetical protein DJ568_11220 [Mucilaginibacter hurinus]